MKQGKKWIALLLAAVFCLTLASCSDLLDDEQLEDDWEEDSQEEAPEMEEVTGDPDQTWAIYWYLCGSDLESDIGAATTDIEEMMEVPLPENVKVVIETGGAAYWQNDFVDSSVNQRLVYSSEGLECVDEQPQANMGDPETLENFLSFCKENYPADKTMVVFWNHGGGSVSGVAFDENYEGDSLSLTEIYQAFNSVYESSREDPPFELVGFDACLMGTIDTAACLSGMTNYMVASEEYEPGGGWFYSGWLGALAENPGYDGAQLGKAICDSYMEGCEMDWVEDETTLSVVDLTKIDPLLSAYEAMGAEALDYALTDSSFFASLFREADRTENYGGNTRDQGYTNMLDLGHLAQNCSDILPMQSKAVLDALDQCVVYKVNGPYRENAMGLSCYFSYNGDEYDLQGFCQEGYSDSFKYLFTYGIEGDLPQEGIDYIQNYGYEEQTVPEVQTLEDASNGELEYPVSIDEEGFAVMELDPEILDMLKSVTFYLSYLDEEYDAMLLLGQDNDIDADWDNGVFRDNFRGVWGAIDGHLVYMEVSFETDQYTGFSVPILLNGEEYNLSVVYDYNDEAFYILGARKGLDDCGMADKNMVSLKPGDEITTILYMATISGDDDFEPQEGETFTVTEDTAFAEAPLGDGKFVMMFELADIQNNTVDSQMIQMIVEGEEIEASIME